MKLNARISLLLVIVMLALPVMAACSGVSFKIDFMVNGEVYDTLDTNGSEVIELPPNPTEEGYEFVGWYWDDVTFTRPFTANSLLDAPLSGDMKVYAKMVEIGTQAVTPVPGTAYKLFVDQDTAGVRIFVNGNKDSYYLATDTNIENALNVYIEEASIEGQYYLFAVKDGARMYINIVKNGNMYNPSFNNAAFTSYKYDATKQTLVATVDGNSLVLGINPAVNYQRIGVRYLSESSYLAHFAVSANPDTEIPGITAIESDIAGVQSGDFGIYKSQGTVIGVNAQSFIIDDGTGKIVVYQGVNWTPDVNVGDVVSVEGLTTVYSGGKQFGRTSTYTVTGTNEVTYGEPKELSINDLNAYSSMTVILPELVKVKGVLEISGTYYNLIVDGTTMKPSVVYPIGEDKQLLDTLVGKAVEVVGYATSVTGGGIYISILAVDIKETTLTPGTNPNPIPTPDELDTPEKIVNAAYALLDGEQINGTLTLSGTVASVDTPYNSDYGNVTVTMIVGNMTDKPIKCYRLSGTGADVIKIGDTITVSGTITNYQGTIEFRQGCTLDSYNSSGAAPTPTVATISEVLAGELGLYTTSGTVVGFNARSFLLLDNGSYILVYKGSSWQRDVAVGDNVTVTGTTSVYGNAKQFGEAATYVKNASGEFTQPTPAELSVTELNAYKTASSVTPKFVKVTGTLTAENNIYTVAVDGAEIQIKITYFPIDMTEHSGTIVEVVGYVTGVSSNGAYLDIMTSTVTGVDPDPDPDPNPDPDPDPDPVPTPEEIVNAAYALQSGESLEGTYTLTGVIITVDTPYNSSYSNITVTMVVDGMTDKPIMCYRMKGDGADVIKIGDTITVTGAIKNHNGTVEFDQNCALDSYVPTTEEIQPTEATIAEVLAGELGLYTTSGTVVCINANSFLLGDDGSYILVYLGNGWTCDVELGDVITITGSTSTYNKAKQFTSSATYEKTATEAVAHPTVAELTPLELDAYKTADTLATRYIKVAGVLNISGNYYNLTIDGATITGSLLYPASQDAAALAELNGQTVSVTGYVTNVTGNGSYLSIMFTSFEAVN